MGNSQEIFYGVLTTLVVSALFTWIIGGHWSTLLWSAIIVATVYVYNNQKKIIGAVKLDVQEGEVSNFIFSFILNVSFIMFFVFIIWVVWTIFDFPGSKTLFLGWYN